MRIDRIIIAAAIALTHGCAAYRPITDMQGVNPAQYEADLRDCQSMAGQVSPGGQAVSGAVIGGALAAIMGGILCGRDCAAIGAGIGAVHGSASGAADGAGGQVQVVTRCMSGRGYMVLK